MCVCVCGQLLSVQKPSAPAGPHAAPAETLAGLALQVQQTIDSMPAGADTYRLEQLKESTTAYLAVYAPPKPPGPSSSELLLAQSKVVVDHWTKKCKAEKEKVRIQNHLARLADEVTSWETKRSNNESKIDELKVEYDESSSESGGDVSGEEDI